MSCRMKIGDEVYVHGYVDEIRKDVIIIRNDGGYFGTVFNEVIADHKTEPSEHRDCINCEDASDCAKCRGIKIEPQTNCPWK